MSTNNKKVAVPFHDFVAGNANVNGNDKLVLPNVSQAQMNALPPFHPPVRSGVRGDRLRSGGVVR